MACWFEIPLHSDVLWASPGTVGGGEAPAAGDATQILFSTEMFVFMHGGIPF